MSRYNFLIYLIEIIIFFPGSLTEKYTVFRYLQCIERLFHIILIFLSFTQVAYRVTHTETIPPLGSLTFCACLSGACAAVRDDGAPGGAC